MQYWQQLIFVGNVTLPIFLLIFLGGYLRHRRQLGNEFVSQSSSLVFNIALPVLMFIAIAGVKFSLFANVNLVVFAALAACLSFLLIWFAAKRYVKVPADFGVFVQGAFRSNLGILGIAMCAMTFAAPGVAIGAVLLAVVTPIYNVLSIYALHYAVNGDKPLDKCSLMMGVAKNPLIVAIILALPVSYWQLELPGVIMATAEYLAALTLPLALLCIGATLSLSSLKEAYALSWWAVLIKTADIAPVGGLGCLPVGLSGC